MASKIPTFRLPVACDGQFPDDEDEVAGTFNQNMLLETGESFPIHLEIEDSPNNHFLSPVNQFRVSIVVGHSVDRLVPDVIDETEKKRLFLENFLDHHNRVLDEDAVSSDGRLTIAARGFCKKCFGCMYGRPMKQKKIKDIFQMKGGRVCKKKRLN